MDKLRAKNRTGLKKPRVDISDQREKGGGDSIERMKKSSSQVPNETLGLSQTGLEFEGRITRRKARTIESLELGQIGGEIEGRVFDKGEMRTFGRSNKFFNFRLAGKTSALPRHQYCPRCIPRIPI